MDSNDPLRNLPLVVEAHNAKRRAATWQIILATFGLIAIVTIFLFGINHQRDETAGQQTAATAPTPASPQGGDTQQQAGPQQPSSTTGQRGGDDKNGDQKDQPQSGKVNGQPASGAPAQSQSK